MLGIRMLRVDDEGLLAANTGIEMPPRLKMLKAGGTESGWCAHRGWIPVMAKVRHFSKGRLRGGCAEIGGSSAHFKPI
jgi:hypothetical protein